MFSLPARILLILTAAAYGTYQLTVGTSVGVVLIAAAGLLVFGYFRYGPIRPAFTALQRGDIERAERLLSTIRFPRLLTSQSRAYLHWINGVLDVQHENRLMSAENNLQTALNLGVRTSNDKCALVATMADLAARGKNLDKAKRLLDGARAIPHNEGAATYIDKLHHEFSNPKKTQDQLPSCQPNTSGDRATEQRDEPEP